MNTRSLRRHFHAGPAGETRMTLVIAVLLLCAIVAVGAARRPADIDFSRMPVDIAGP